MRATLVSLHLVRPIRVELDMQPIVSSANTTHLRGLPPTQWQSKCTFLALQRVKLISSIYDSEKLSRFPSPQLHEIIAGSF